MLIILLKVVMDIATWPHSVGYAAVAGLYIIQYSKRTELKIFNTIFLAAKLGAVVAAAFAIVEWLITAYVWYRSLFR